MVSAVERVLSPRVECPDDILGAVVRLALQAAAALELASEAGKRRDAVGASSAGLGRGIARAEDWMRRAGMRTLVAEKRPLPSSATIARRLSLRELTALLAWVTEPDAGGPRPKRLGALYQELLLLRLHRLEGRSVCLRPSGVWISAREVLRQPARTRGKWVQRAAGLPKSAVLRLGEPLAQARTEDGIVRALAAERTKGPLGARGELVVEEGSHRRRAGAHYTPDALCRAVVEKTLRPLIEGASPRAILDLKVCDPAMGDGAFLEAAAQFLAGKAARGPKREPVLRAVVEQCLFGVDKDPIAADLARWSLARLATHPGSPPPDLSSRLGCADALVGRSSSQLEESGDSPPPCAVFDWPVAFSDVFGRSRPGFDACIGNPPWVAYVGRAAQPLAPESFDYYLRTNPAFHGYRTLHGLFVRRAAELVRPGGRLGLVVPTSVADLDGYTPTRRAHDALCDVDRDLTDFGDGAFAGVFQPCMALTSTRRASSKKSSKLGLSWTLSRTDLDARGLALLARLSALPPLDAGLFGERGFQTTKDDLSRLRRLPRPRPPFIVPVHEGADVGELTLLSPSLFLDPSKLTGRLRPEAEWRAVPVLIRQTARYPIAALSDGHAFRNSILAGFSDTRWTPRALSAYLNSSVVRWFHFVRHRDARQGMPQLKVGHLRALPDLASEGARAHLGEIGGRLGSAGLGAPDRRALDETVFDALALDDAERRIVTEWTRAHPLPKPRKRRPEGALG